MYAIVQKIRKSRSCTKPQLVKQTFDTQEEAEHYIRRYRDKYPYTTAEFSIAEVNIVTTYNIDIVPQSLVN